CARPPTPAVPLPPATRKARPGASTAAWRRRSGSGSNRAGRHPPAPSPARAEARPLRLIAASRSGGEGGPAPAAAGSDHAECVHRVGDADKAGDIGPEHVIAGRAVFLGRLRAGVMDVVHDLGEAVLGSGEAPAVTRGVLLH